MPAAGLDAVCGACEVHRRYHLPSPRPSGEPHACELRAHRRCRPGRQQPHGCRVAAERPHRHLEEDGSKHRATAPPHAPDHLQHRRRHLDVARRLARRTHDRLRPRGRSVHAADSGRQSHASHQWHGVRRSAALLARRQNNRVRERPQRLRESLDRRRGRRNAAGDHEGQGCTVPLARLDARRQVHRRVTYQDGYSRAARTTWCWSTRTEAPGSRSRGLAPVPRQAGRRTRSCRRHSTTTSVPRSPRTDGTSTPA